MIETFSGHPAADAAGNACNACNACNAGNAGAAANATTVASVAAGRSPGSARWRTGAVAVLLGAGAVGGFAQASPPPNLVANGSFEQGLVGIGSFAGWQTALGDAATFVDSNGQTGRQFGQASDGLWSAFFGSAASSGGATVSQTLATTAGQAYDLSFDLADDNAGAPSANRLVGLVDGAAIFSLADLASQGYARRTFSFVAGAGATRLSLSAYNDTGYLQLDQVSVTAAVPAVPEPGAAWLMAPGLAGLAAWVRRRRRLDRPPATC